MFRRLGHIQSCACVAMWYVRQTVVRWKRGKMETKLLESGTEAFEWWSFRLSVKWACKTEKGRGKWNRWLQNYERPLWFPLNFISPFFLATLPSNPLILSHHVLSSLCFGFLYQILSQFDFLLTPYVGLQAGSIPFTSSLHLRHMKPPPPSWVSHCSFMYFALSLLYFPFSRSRWGHSIAAEKGDASQLTLWHRSELISCNGAFFS